MSKNIKLNDNEYKGISVIQLPTSDNETASFMDADDVVIPDGTLEITQNGPIDVYNYAMANVNVSGGGSVETGTFVGDGTYKVTLPVTSKKRGFAIKINDYDNIVTNELSTIPEQSVLTEIYDSGFGFQGQQRRYGDKTTNAAGMLKSSYAEDVIFNDNSITKKTMFNVAQETYAIGKTYTWIAW